MRSLVRLRGTSRAGVGLAILYDTATPTSIFTVPTYALLPNVASGKAFNQLPAITGTASGDVGVRSVGVAIQNIGIPSLWFDGAAFTQNNPVFLLSTGTSLSVWNSTYTANLSAFLNASGDHSQYVFVTSATAFSGLTQNIFANTVSSFTLTYDKTPPSASVTVPNGNGLAFQHTAIGQGGTLLSGNSSDSGALAAGVQDVQILLSYLNGNDTYYWTSAVFSSNTVASASWQKITTNDAWTYTTPVAWNRTA